MCRKFFFSLENKKRFFFDTKKCYKGRKNRKETFFSSSKKDQKHKRVEVNSHLNIKSLFYGATNLFRDNKKRQKAKSIWEMHCSQIFECLCNKRKLASLHPFGIYVSTLLHQKRKKRKKKNLLTSIVTFEILFWRKYPKLLQ